MPEASLQEPGAVPSDSAGGIDTGSCLIRSKRFFCRALFPFLHGSVRANDRTQGASASSLLQPCRFPSAGETPAEGRLLQACALSSLQLYADPKQLVHPSPC